MAIKVRTAYYFLIKRKTPVNGIPLVVFFFFFYCTQVKFSCNFFNHSDFMNNFK